MRQRANRIVFWLGAGAVISLNFAVAAKAIDYTQAVQRSRKESP